MSTDPLRAAPVRIDPVLAQTLAAVVDEGSLEAASRRLHLTPSAVSQRVRQLEQQLGRRMLVRSRPVSATGAGQAVIRFARRHALIEHEAHEALGLDGEAQAPRISVAVNSDSSATWFIEPLAAFVAAHDVQVEVLREDQDATARLLESGAAMAAVTSSSLASPGCSVTPLGSLVYEAVAAPQWCERWCEQWSAESATLRESRPPSADVLSRAPRIDFDRTDQLQAQWLRAHDVDPADAPRHFVPSTHDLASAVVEGLGWAMMPLQQSVPLREEGRLIPLGGPEVTTPLYWQAWRTPPALLRDLGEHVEAAARRELRAG
ncbi:ArgP/LysG family DNA-binding transcriptional regulator [Brachybacterium halotolerans subsp. kimchii]|uniref:ArgP/LysG family DNA-binding transcriptional regulator n=1 Tax=Brachybacterium halotolerans TaxID=2795215 RepID=UPI001E527690|nr:ArgP/LysG family DNA-binding transcriptional regulator [Brachybacterium halotolerans]UEJ83856.1 ArgP/LysG family DNA-binding transcriptional regulator [Brachybacterium halotolerans subsp. kimchii]